MKQVDTIFNKMVEIQNFLNNIELEKINLTKLQTLLKDKFSDNIIIRTYSLYNLTSVEYNELSEDESATFFLKIAFELGKNTKQIYKTVYCIFLPLWNRNSDNAIQYILKAQTSTSTPFTTEELKVSFQKSLQTTSENIQNKIKEAQEEMEIFATVATNYMENK